MAPRGVYSSVIIEYNVKKGTFIEPSISLHLWVILVPRYTADCENFADVPDNVSDDIPDDDIPDDDISDDDIPDDASDDTSDDTSDDILDDVSDNTSIPDDMSDILNDIPDDISDDILGDISDDTPDDMSIDSMGEKDSSSLLVNIASEADTTYRSSKVKDTLDGRCSVQLSGR